MSAMVYVDTSVVIAHVRAETVQPPDRLWAEELVASRLLEYETWSRLHARSSGESHGDAARGVFARLAFLELVQPVVERAAEPFPVPLRTLDALHLASALFLIGQGVGVRLATYDHRMAAAAEALGIESYPL